MGTVSKGITWADGVGGGTAINKTNLNLIAAPLLAEFNGSIENANIGSSAAIDFSKLAILTSTKILVGNGSNVAASVSVSGDITITNAGVVAIASGVVVNADVKSNAAIAYSKLNLSTSIVNADVNSSAAIDVSKIDFATMDADIAATRANSSTTAWSLACNSITTGRGHSVTSSSSDTGESSLYNAENTNTSAVNRRLFRFKQEADFGFIEFTSSASTGASTSDAISTLTTLGSVAGNLQIIVLGSKRWIPFYQDPS